MPQYSEGQYLGSGPRGTCPENRTAFPSFCYYPWNNRKYQCTLSRPVIPPVRRLILVLRVAVNDSPFLLPSLQ